VAEPLAILPFIPISSPMKALISCIVSLLLLATGVVASWYVWFRPDAKPIAAARLAAAEAAKSTVESITGKKFMIEGSDKNSADDLPRRSNDKPESENDLFAERERQQRDAQDRKQYAEDARLRPLVYPKARRRCGRNCRSLKWLSFPSFRTRTINTAFAAGSAAVVGIPAV
jgi:hypothetical protein